jgi:CheY-like chemotaxis protein
VYDMNKLFLRETRAEIAMTSQNNTQAQSQGEFILCVDDEATGLSVRKMILESQGYRVVTAENGPDGLAIFSAQPIDLVVLDYKMPGMNGDVVAERMKQLKPSIPILMLSAYVDLPSETLALVDRYLTKGEDPLMMLKAVAELLTKTQMVKAISRHVMD